MRWVALKRAVDPARPITYGIVQAGPHIEGGVPYIRPVDMTDHHGVANPADLQRTSLEIARQYRRSSVRRGDIVVSIGPSYGKTMVVPPDLDGANLTQGTARIAPAASWDVRFLRWCLRSMAHWDSAVGGATFRALNLGPLAETPIPLHPLAEQRAIADYLDAETARIDALIAKKQQLIHLLEERRWRLFDELSGVCSPDMVPLRRVLTFLTDGPFGSAFSSADYVDDGVAVIRLGNIGFAEFRGGDLAHLPAHRLDEFARYRVRAGDLLVAALGDDRNHGGRACVAPDLGLAIVKGKCFCGRIDERAADAEYVALACSSPSAAERFRLDAQGSTRQMINLEIFKSLRVPLPSVEQQRRVVTTTRQAWAQLDQTVKALSGQIDLLTEHRRAMISASVAGAAVG